MRDDISVFQGGFAKPVFEAQNCFEKLLRGFAEPGSLQKLNYKGGGPKLLPLASAAIALTLCDETTPVWLSSGLQNGGSIAKWLAFHTGASVVSNKTDAHFALFEKAAALPSFESFSQGSQDYPDRAATLIIPVEGFESGTRYSLKGPGIETQRKVQIAGLPEMFLSHWQANASRFPKGTDVVLVADTHMMCLPRTTRVSALEDASCM